MKEIVQIELEQMPTHVPTHHTQYMSVGQVFFQVILTYAITLINWSFTVESTHDKACC